jgi:hypothetical protein
MKTSKTAPPSPRIDILQRGGTKQHGVLRRAALHILRERMSARMANSLSVRIEVRSTKLEEGAAAVAWLPTNGSTASRSFTVVLDRERPLILQIRDLAHELVHVEQAATGRLQYRLWRTDGKVHARWEGSDLGPLSCLPYATRPWEVEAYAAETGLANSFLRSDAEARAECGLR